MIAKKRSRGGDLKTEFVPAGYYGARDACLLLSTSRTTLGNLVRRGEIGYYVPAGKENGYYEQTSVDHLAEMIREDALHLIQNSSSTQRGVTYEWANAFDLQGISEVLHSFGWPTPDLKLRQAWWQRNPHIYYVCKYRNLVIGYISILSHPWDITNGLLGGRLRGSDLKPWDSLPFMPGEETDVHFGIAVRDVPAKRYYAGRLMRQFFFDLGRLAAQEEIVIRRMYGMTDEEDGRRLAQDLAFTQLPKEPGDLFGERYVLDLKTSDTRFARQYRATWKK